MWRNRALPAVELFHGSYRNHDFAPHYHSVATIGVVDRGVMRSRCRRADHVATAGSIILYNPGEVHAPGPGNNELWSFRTFYLDDSLYRGFGMNVSAGRLNFKQPLVQDQELATGLLQLHQAFEKTATSLELESSLLVLLNRVAQRYACAASEAVPCSREPEKVSRVRDFIHENYWHDVSLAKLAEIATLSPYHLLRTFRSTVGLTPHAYVVQTRIEAAKELLRSGVAPVDVAASTGFVDQSHFSRQFKRIVGTTPGQYHPRW